MQWRSVTVVIGVVAVGHWLVLFSPIQWQGAFANFTPAMPQRLEAIWVQPPPIAVSAPSVPTASAQSFAPTPQPIKQRTPKLPRKRHPASPATVHAATPAAPTSTPPLDIVHNEDEATSEAIVSIASPPAHDLPTPDGDGETMNTDTADATPAASAPPTGPSLVVHDAQQAIVTLDITNDGSALAQQQQLRYRVHGFVKGMEYHASAQLQWSLADGRYGAKQTISAFLLGSMEQTSQGLWTAQGLQPEDFSDRRFAKRRHVHFDWAQRQAQFDPIRPAAAIGAGAQDRLSVFLQLAAMLQSMPSLRAAGTRIDIPTLGSRSLQMWTFVVEAMDDVELPSGIQAALRLRRQPLAGDSAQAQLWLSPDLGFLPSRIRMQESNGDVMELLLKPE